MVIAVYGILTVVDELRVTGVEVGSGVLRVRVVLIRFSVMTGIVAGVNSRVQTGVHSFRDMRDER